MCAFFCIIAAWSSSFTNILCCCNRISFGYSYIHQLSIDCFISISHNDRYRSSVFLILGYRFYDTFIRCKDILAFLRCDKNTRIAAIRPKCLEIHGRVHTERQNNLAFNRPYKCASFIIGICNDHSIFVDDYTVTACLFRIGDTVSRLCSVFSGIRTLRVFRTLISGHLCTFILCILISGHLCAFILCTRIPCHLCTFILCILISDHLCAFILCICVSGYRLIRICLCRFRHLHFRICNLPGRLRNLW